MITFTLDETLFLSGTAKLCNHLLADGRICTGSMVSYTVMMLVHVWIRCRTSWVVATVWRAGTRRANAARSHVLTSETSEWTALHARGMAMHGFGAVERVDSCSTG
jgi:hypothetical protein